MNLALGLLAILAALVLALVGVTRIGVHGIERRNPPAGSFATVNGTRLHYVHVPAGSGADLPPVVLVHGASGNLLDQMVPLRRHLEGRAELLFVDRPGHGWSGRGPASNGTPAGQADTLAALLDHLGIGNAVLLGHSFGASVVADFAVRHPARTRGLVFLAAASHPWPGAGTSWYYRVASRPLLGRLFAETIALPAGMLRIRRASECVFSPNPLPESYLRDAAIELVLRPRAFRANAIDVDGLYDHVVVAAPRYRDIAAPTVIVSGDRDTVVYEEIHSEGLARDITGSELVWVRNLGHKPEWVAPDLVVAAIERVAGRQVDLPAAAALVEARVAGDSSGVGICEDPGVPHTVTR